MNEVRDYENHDTIIETQNDDMVKEEVALKKWKQKISKLMIAP